MSPSKNVGAGDHKAPGQDVPGVPNHESESDEAQSEAEIRDRMNSSYRAAQGVPAPEPKIEPGDPAASVQKNSGG